MASLLRASRASRVRPSLRALAALSLPAIFALSIPASPSRAQTAETFASQTTIVRDDYGVPHIDGPTDASVAFGYGYAQCEDYFWQLEDSYIMSLGRYAEINGEAGLENDLLNRTFEIVPRAKTDYAEMPDDIRAMADAFVMGINWYLEHHPEVKPRLLTRWEPWYVAAYERHIILGFLYGNAPAGQPNQKMLDEWRGHVGSNGWAVGPSRTKDGTAMLYANPHQPYFGHGQFTEAHLHSGEGLNTSGASFIGGFVVTIGHNGRLGWTHTVNEPSLGSAWIETFDKPDDPLAYRYDGEYRRATEWKDSVKIKTKEGFEDREYTFRKTHHGPIVGKRDDQHYVSVRIARLFDGNRAVQWLAMGRSKNLEEFKTAMDMLYIPMFNTLYADADGNIFYAYNGAIPSRDESFDWRRPVDGSTSKSEWGDLIPFRELPQTTNPASGYIQNCNSTPYTTTDVGNPPAKEYPSYIARDLDDDKRRAQMSRHLLREARDLTFDDWKRLALDTHAYWPMTELPRYDDVLERKIKTEDPDLYAKARPLLDHLMDWNFEVTVDSTQATLCSEWYFSIYDGFYPAEYLKAEFKNDWAARFRALVESAERIEKGYGNWKTKWGDVYVIQRHANHAFGGATDIMKIPFRDNEPSFALPGAQGPLGVAFTVYYTPKLFGKNKRYAIVGNSYMGVYEFGKDGVKAGSLLQFGQCAIPESPHFDDQAELLGKKQFKPAYFDWDDVEAAAVAKYHPGDEGTVWWDGKAAVKR